MRKPLYSNQKFPLRLIIKYCSKRPFLYFFSAEILITGCWAEEAFGKDFFSRSGAIVTLLALGILWLWLRYERELEATSDLIEGMKRYAGRNIEFSAILNNLMRLNPNVAVRKQAQVAGFIHAVVTEGPPLEIDLKDVTKSLSFAQVEVAIIGTFVWAFGDLFV